MFFFTFNLTIQLRWYCTTTFSLRGNFGLLKSGIIDKIEPMNIALTNELLGKKLMDELKALVLRS